MLQFENTVRYFDYLPYEIALSIRMLPKTNMIFFPRAQGLEADRLNLRDGDGTAHKGLQKGVWCDKHPYYRARNECHEHEPLQAGG